MEHSNVSVQVQSSARFMQGDSVGLDESDSIAVTMPCLLVPTI